MASFPDAGDAEAVRLATAMGAAVTAAVDVNDAEGLAARRAANEFAEKEAELDALLAADSGSDDDGGGVGGGVKRVISVSDDDVAPPTSHFEALLAGIPARELPGAPNAAGDSEASPPLPPGRPGMLPRLQARRLADVLSANGFEGDDCVPAWLLRFFTALWTMTPSTVEGEPCGGLPRDGEGDVGEFFTDLSQLGVGGTTTTGGGAVAGAMAPGFDCYDHGPWVRVKLGKAGMLGLVAAPHGHASSWTVASLASVPGDGAGDLSLAKVLSRPA
jgi:hypothetical protein